MLKLVTCPEFERPARIDADPARRTGRERVLYCSLWDREEVVEACREGCVAAFHARSKSSKRYR